MTCEPESFSGDTLAEIPNVPACVAVAMRDQSAFIWPGAAYTIHFPVNSLNRRANSSRSVVVG